MMNLIRVFYVICSAIGGAVLYEAFIEHNVSLGIAGLIQLIMLCRTVINTENLK